MNATVYRHRTLTNNATYLIADHDALGAVFLADEITEVAAADTILDSAEEARAELDADADWARDDTARVELSRVAGEATLTVHSQTHPQRSARVLWDA